jgi:hypothetical protein
MNFLFFELPVHSVRELSKQKMIQGQWRRSIKTEDSIQQNSNQIKEPKKRTPSRFQQQSLQRLRCGATWRSQGVPTIA